MFIPRQVDLYVYLREYFCHITSNHTFGMEGIIIEYLHMRGGQACLIGGETQITPISLIGWPFED
jgi:hypothetical protein